MTSPVKKPIFPHTFDSTMLGTGRSCPQKLFRQYIQHWKPKTESVHLIAGGAFASGIEAARRCYYEGRLPVYSPAVLNEEGVEIAPPSVTHIDCETGDPILAESAGLGALLWHYGDFECPPESPKSAERMAGALEFYFTRYPLGRDGTIPITLPSGRTGIEFSFAEPLPINHPVTGDPILYTGRSDMIAEFAGGTYVFDEKTASQLGASWSRQWEMRSQFTGYMWAAERAGIKTDGAIVRGVSILKRGYDTLQAITNRSQYEVNRWLEQTCRDIERFTKMWQEGWWDYSLDHACAEYGGCSMVQICKSSNPETWLEMYFERRVWDPLLRKELTVEEYEASWEKPDSLLSNPSALIKNNTGE